MTENTPHPSQNGRGAGSVMAIALVVLLLGGLGYAYFRLRGTDRELQRAQGALELQVLASRLGAGALQAEYGQYESARDVVSGVFDGIVNYGIAHGSLPQNYATVLQERDPVVVALAQGRPEVTARLVELFFLLQLPVHTELNPEFIIPATDSGFGMAPPARVGVRPDSVVRPTVTTPQDTTGS